jgi:hypothetical protein
MKKCKPHQELNPFTNRCVIKCVDGKKRHVDEVNKKFTCLNPIKHKDKFPDEPILATVTEFTSLESGPASPGPASPGPASPGPASPGPASPGPASPGPASPTPTEADEENIQFVISDYNDLLQMTHDDDTEKIRKKKLNALNRTIELKERSDIIKSETTKDYLYPNLNDPLFNIKITEKKEFNDAKYNGEIVNVEKQAEILCNAEFELAPQQLFVRNFLSFQTPYNSLLLYHGLGSGKTCSAISVAEEMRDYLIQMNIEHEIIVIANPNVQDNFKLQLFDERKLKEIDGIWNIQSCTSNKFLKEINPMNMKGLTRENVINQIKKIINNYYSFMGYIQFANYVNKESTIDSSIKGTKQRTNAMRQKLRRLFSNRLIIIDEVHNIRIADDNSENKRVAMELFKLVENVDNLRLLLLSATPMYNSYKEIIWLVNLMNMNDRRPTIEIGEVFDVKKGTFKISKTGEEIGRELLERKATGYISFVRGENPYTFPYRLWPNEFAVDHTFLNENNPHPTQQLNGKEIIQQLEILSVYLVDVGKYQQKGYDYILNQLKNDVKKDKERRENYKREEEEVEKTDSDILSFENMESFGYTMLQRPLEALNMIYPHPDLLGVAGPNVVGPNVAGPNVVGPNVVGPNENISINELVGKAGLARMMSYEESSSSRFNFEYKDPTLHIFAPNEIGNYSGKIKSICDCIMNSTGVVLIYSQYIDGGVLPIALALEELGFTRAGIVKSLFKTAPTPPIDALTKQGQAKQGQAQAKQKQGQAKQGQAQANQKQGQAKQGQAKQKQAQGQAQAQAPFYPAKYVMITGDKSLSPNNVADIKLSTNVDNKDGSRVKVVFISQAGAEGLDLKFIRQVHILEPWYNMNRIEQIIGRAVRTCSHKDLPFNKRNVEIYLYGSLMENKREEAADLYVYRLAELKAVQIGNVSRVLKEIAVDCILNYEQIGFNFENMNQRVTLELSSRGTLEYDVGDKPYSSTCDYLKKCQFVCKPSKEIKDEDVKLDTYNEQFIMMNTDKIVHKIRSLMKERYFYRKNELIALITAIKFYPLVQINAALEQLVEDKYEYITDKYNRLGNLVNIGDMYLFQPLELNNKNISIHDRSVPIDFKHEKLIFIQHKKGEEEEPPLDIESLHIVRQPSVQQNKLQILFTQLTDNYNLASASATALAIDGKGWYDLCRLVINDLIDKKVSSRDSLLDILVAHIIDEISFEDRLLIMNNLDTITTSDFGKRVRNYINADVITNKGIIGMMVNNNGEVKILVKNKDNSWNPAQAEDIIDLEQELKKRIDKFTPVENKLNTIIGFMAKFKDYVTFKIKDLTKPRQKGARCDQSDKNSSIKLINELIGKELYDKPVMTRIQVCIIVEFILRLYNKENKNGLYWFLNPVEALSVKIEKATKLI